MICKPVFRQRNHAWLVFGQDPEKPDAIIDTNQLVVVSGNTAVLLDPGGMEIFPPMLEALTEQVPIENVHHIFISHQDPDTCSSLALWRQVCPNDLLIHAPWMWTGFISHFDQEARFTAIPDQGTDLKLPGGVTLRLLPAHYLHSPGNYNVYDPEAGVLFSGDIGAALVPAKARRDFFVDDFASHVQYMEAFHKRWMGSSAARDAWVAQVARLKVDVMAPQHGLLFRGDDVKRFLDWFAALEIGVGVGVMSAGATTAKAEKPAVAAKPAAPAPMRRR